MIETIERAGGRTGFRALKVQTVRPEAGDSIVVTLDVPGDARESYAFAAGQHLTLRRDVDGEELRRSYSICAAPSQGRLEIAIRRVENGRFSGWALDSLAAGDVIEAMPPTGHFTVPGGSGGEREVVFIAAGSGITPILSQMQALLEDEPDARATLLYLNRSIDSTMFVEELLALKNRYLSRCTLYFQTSQESADGALFDKRLDRVALKQLLSDGILPLDAEAWMVCGPQALVDLIRSTVPDAGIDLKRVHSELFGISAASAPKAPEGVGDSQATVRFNGRSSNVAVPAGVNLLDAARRLRSDLPFACKTGVCSTCRCKILKGEVDMIANYALEPQELANGFVLSCQSYPKTDHIEVDFDA